MSAFAELDLEARTDQLKKAADEVRKIGIEGDKTEAKVKQSTDAMNVGMTKLGASSAQVSGSLTTMRTNAASLSGGMAGLAASSRGVTQQLSQVAQQTMATGQFVQALAIQLPDIGLAFGALGTVLGVVAGIALPLVISALGGGKDKAEEMEDALDALSASVRSFQASSEAASAPLNDMIEQYGSLAFVARAALQEINAVEQAKALIALSAAADLVAGSFGSINDVFTDEGGFLRASDAWFELSQGMDLGVDAANRLVRAMKDLDDAPGAKEQAVAARTLAATLTDVFGEYSKMPPEIQNIYEATQSLILKAGQYTGELESSGIAVSKLSNSDFGATRLGIAVGEAAKLAGNLWDAAAAAAAQINAQNKLSEIQMEFSEGGQAMLKYGGRGASSDASALAKTHDMTGAIIPPKVAGASRRGGGGGGAAASDGFEDRLSALTEQFATEQQLADQWYEESQAVLSDRRALELLGKEEHAEMLLSVEEEYQSRLAEIKSNGHEAERQMMSQTIDATVGLLQQFGAKSKGLAIAALAVNAARRVMEIRANTAAAVMRAYAELGPIAGSAAAAKIKVMGAVQTGIALASATLGAASGGGGGGGGGGITDGSREATSAPAQQERIVRLDVRGEGMFADMLRESGAAIVDALTNESKFGGTTVIMGR